MKVSSSLVTTVPLPDLNSFHVVGIGASAGGIEALSRFFDAVPAEPGLAFVVVLHLDPTRESQLSSILARHTSMPVVEIEDGMRVAPDHVYVIAPDRDLTLSAGRLRLTTPEQPRGHRHPVDVLFRSLAEQYQEQAIAIVLSGTGSNGTEGLREIKAAGGLILAQDPADARFGDMPRSAISAGLPDFVLAPADMPTEILRFARKIEPRATRTSPLPARGGNPGLDTLLGLLRGYSSDRFRSYKPATLLRRINRRMGLKGIADLAAYTDLLRRDPSEIPALASDLLISVTSFFRDAEAWKALEQTFIDKLIETRDTNSPIRIWVSACATGEEAYSVAMLLLEHAEAAGKQFDIKIFASDILESNLAVARAGRYTGASVDRLPTARARRFFDKIDGSYEIRKTVRDLIIFARQDMLSDPPFSRMDLITCRNMFIYIEPDAQRRILSLFHFALRDGGCLFLGTAETIGRDEALFETVSKKWRIYRRIGGNRLEIARFARGDGRPAPAVSIEGPAVLDPSVRASEIARRTLLERYAPPCVLVNPKGHILYFHGDTADYLKQPTGEPTRNLLLLARGTLLSRLRDGLKTVANGGGGSGFRLRMQRDGRTQSVLVTLSPMPNAPPTAGLVLITFEADADQARTVSDDPPRHHGRGETSSELEEELRLARLEQQTTIEQFESVNEELKASNEESISMNEELQSANEELETSKEELQSFNEELHSVNSQLQHKINELEEASNDLFNLLSGTEIATIFLDTALQIKWFSPTTKQLFDLVPSDIGRPITHFSRKFSDKSLLSDAETVLTQLVPIEVEIQGEAKQWYLRRLLPYRTRDNRIIGLVLTFIDVTERKKAEAADALLHLNRELEHRVAERTQEFETANRQLHAEIAARRRIEEELIFLANHDRLTGLPNRRHFSTILPDLVAEATASGKRIAVLCLDLDRFKSINDELGHQAGDRLLEGTARRLTSLIRHSDIVARVGGDEFIAVLTHLETPDEAMALARRIVEALNEAIEIGDDRVQVGVSIGITIVPTDGSTAEKVLRNGDLALYRAKKEGGNGWRFFEPGMETHQLARRTVETDLRRALERDEFELLFQPVIDIPSGRTLMFEALLRWHHPDRGLLHPISFISVAEESGLIVQIGKLVLQRACTEAAGWPADVSVAVNLSGVQVRHRSIIETIDDVLAQSGLPSTRLELEITESVLLDPDTRTMATLRQLHEIGVQIAMDDFGTGYSSLSQLRNFPYSKIKIDHSFIQALAEDEQALAIVRAILDLGRGLRMVVTAEGVETPAQFDTLKQLGCAQAQGHLLGHPMPAGAIPAHLAKGPLHLW